MSSPPGSRSNRTSVGGTSVDFDRQSVNTTGSMYTEHGTPLLRCDVLYDPDAILTPTQPFSIHLHNQDSVMIAYKISLKHPERYVVAAGTSSTSNSSSSSSSPAAPMLTASGRKGIVLKGGNNVVTIFMKPPLDPVEAEAQAQQGGSTPSTGSSNHSRPESAAAGHLPYFVPPANPPASDLFQVELRAVFAESLRDDGSPSLSPSSSPGASPSNRRPGGGGSRPPGSPSNKKDDAELKELVAALMSRFDQVWNHSISVSTHKVPATLRFISPQSYVKHLSDMAAQRVARLNAEKQNLTKQLEDLAQKTETTLQRNKDFEKEIVSLEVEAMQKCGVLTGGKVGWFWGMSGIAAAFLLPLMVA